MCYAICNNIDNIIICIESNVCVVNFVMWVMLYAIHGIF